MVKVFYRVILNTKKADTANQLLDGFTDVIDDCEVKSCKPYWKDDTKYVATIVQEHEDLNIGDVVCEVLSSIADLSPHWHVTLTKSMESLSGVCDKSITVQDVDWINVEVYSE